MQTFKQPLTTEEEIYYLTLCKEGDAHARDILIEYNMRLVAHIARKYINSAYDNEDLISAGTVGLIKAIDTFDYSKGSRLVTYASRCIENELLMMLRHDKKRLREISLYEPIGTDKEGNELNLMDIINEDSLDVIDDMIHDYHIDVLPGYIESALTPREQTILAMRYGLDGRSARTQKDVAERLNISRSYVSRIEKRALHKLRKALDT
jgi:RNA polymerase sporulation-specific sigma factor